MNPEYPPKATLIPGRFQPLHRGHIALARKLLAEGRKVVFGVFETSSSRRNPYSMATRFDMIRAVFHGEMMDCRVNIVVLPWVEDIAYGRDCGWTPREVRLDVATEQITATQLREEMMA